MKRSILFLLTALTGVMLSNTAVARSFDTSEIIEFGHYEQDGDTSNGMEPIKWRVVSKNADGSLLLLSWDGLEGVRYNDELIDVTWEQCTLRKWFNTEFYDTAFTAEEKSYIVPQHLSNPDNAEFGTEGGNDTIDMVWTLSLEETEAYDLERTYFYLCSPSEKIYRTVALDSASVMWWLRSPGMNSTCAAYVEGGLGYVFDLGRDVNDHIVAARPAIVVNFGW